MATLTIDGKEIQAPKGEAILDAARENGITIRRGDALERTLGRLRISEASGNSARLAKTVHGQFLTLQAVSERRAELAKQIHERLGPGVLERALPAAPDVNGRSPGLLESIGLAFRNDLTHRSEKRRIRTALRAAGVPAAKRRMVGRTLREESRLRQQVLLLKPFQQLFHYWHVLHLPLAIVMFLILILHVAVAVAFGYGWVFG